MTVYPFVDPDTGHQAEVLLAGNIITSTSLLGAHVIEARHSRHLMLSCDAMTHALSLANTRFHVVYESPFLAFGLWAFILYTIKYGGRMRNS